jgi:Origin of replication binding protein
MFETFDRIRKSEKNGTAIEDSYSLADLRNKFVVWKVDRVKKSTKTEYRVYDSHNDFMDELDFIDVGDRLFHEVITGSQKLKFDIDMKSSPLEFEHSGSFPEIVASGSSNLDDPPEIVSFNHIINYFSHHIKQVFFDVYQIELDNISLVVCDSSRVGVKYSSHIIIDGFYVSSYKQAAEITNRINNVINKQYKDIFDTSVNKAIQNFRVYSCHNGDMRIKKIITDHTVAASLITNVSNCISLPDIIDNGTDTVKTKITPSGGDIELAVDLVKGITKGHTYRCMRNNMMLYDRDCPTHCEICLEVHHNDNSMLISMVSSTKTVKLYMFCRQCPTKESIFVGEFEPLNSAMLVEKSGSWPESIIRRNIEGNVVASKWKTDMKLSQIKNQNVYCDPVIRDFEVADTLIVKAMMKMGKTKTLKRYIETHYSTNGLVEPIIRIVSFRQTFSNNIKEKFPDFILYNDVSGELTQDRLIVQIESLHRLKVWAGGSPPDLLILDECESIFEQFNAGLIKNVDCFSKFMYLLRFSKRVILMDALVSDRTYNILAKLRSNDNIVYHHNTYKNATEDVYKITHNYDIWLKTILESLANGERIAIPSSSLKIATEVERIIRDKFPALAVKIYSSNTKLSEKKIHLGNVAYYWKQYDVVIYTPTISAGVSFEEKHFDKVFAYFTDKSCPVETCIQMMGRVRDVSSKTYYLCLNASGNNYPCDISEIEESLKNTRSVLYTDSTNTTSMAINPEYSFDGSLILHKTPFYTVWLENTRMINISKNYFVSKFLGILREFGAKLEQFVVESIEDNEADFTETKKKVKKQIKEELETRISTANDISVEEVAEIRKLIDSQEDLTDPQQNEYDKFKLKQDYCYDGNVDAKFVANYFRPDRRKIHKNIKKIYVSPTHQESLLTIQREERASNRYFMESELEQNDLAKTYMYSKHKCAISLLQNCGWNSLNDDTAIHEVLLAAAFIEKGFAQIVGDAAAEFNIREPYQNTALIAKMDSRLIIHPYIKFIEKVFNIMYAVRIGILENEVGEQSFILKRSKLFKYDFGLECHIK